MTGRASHRGGAVLWVLCLACAPAWVAQVGPDPRAAHLRTPGTAGDLFKASLEPLGLGDPPASDSFLLLAPETRWEEDAPAPARFQHRHVERKTLENTRLFELVNALLPQVEANLPTPRDR